MGKMVTWSRWGPLMVNTNEELRAGLHVGRGSGARCGVVPKVHPALQTLSVDQVLQPHAVS